VPGIAVRGFAGVSAAADLCCTAPGYREVEDKFVAVDAEWAVGIARCVPVRSMRSGTSRSDSTCAMYASSIKR
jgi:hypothetical protein